MTVGELIIELQKYPEDEVAKIFDGVLIIGDLGTYLIL